MTCHSNGDVWYSQLADTDKTVVQAFVETNWIPDSESMESGYVFNQRFVDKRGAAKRVLEILRSQRYVLVDDLRKSLSRTMNIDIDFMLHIPFNNSTAALYLSRQNWIAEPYVKPCLRMRCMRETMRRNALRKSTKWEKLPKSCWIRTVSNCKSMPISRPNFQVSLILIAVTEETGAPYYWTNGTDPFGASWFVKVSGPPTLSRWSLRTCFICSRHCLHLLSENSSWNLADSSWKLWRGRWKSSVDQ